MNIHNDWMTNNEMFGNDYMKNLQVQQVKERFDMQRYQSNEGYSVLTDGVIEQIVVQSYTNPFNEFKEERKLQLPLDSVVKRGSLIEWLGFVWLVTTDIDNDNGAYKSAKMTKTNYTLNWVNSNGFVVSSRCVEEDERSFSKGIANSKFIISGDTNRIISLPRNTETLKIKRDDRFIISRNSNVPIGFKVIKVDDTSSFGLVILTLQEQGGEISTTNDNLTLMIADYYNKIATYHLSILNGESLSVNISDKIQISCEVTKTQNNITTIVSPTPSITYESSDINKATVSNTGLVTLLQTGNVNIIAKLTSDLTVLDTLALTIISSPIDNYTYSLTGDSSIKLNSTATYVAKRFKNNVEMVGEYFDFEIISDSTPLDKYNFTIIDGNSCSIKCLGYVYSVILRAYLRSDHSIYIDKVIQLKGLV